jgi:hypothetical protein
LTPGVWPSQNDSTSARSLTNRRHADRHCSGNSAAAALARGASHEQVSTAQRAHAIGTGSASPPGGPHFVGEDRRPFGPHRPRSQGGAGSLRGTGRPRRPAQRDGAHSSSRARHAGPHDTAGLAVCPGASTSAGLLNG